MLQNGDPIVIDDYEDVGDITIRKIKDKYYISGKINVLNETTNKIEQRDAGKVMDANQVIDTGQLLYSYNNMLSVYNAKIRDYNFQLNRQTK